MACEDCERNPVYSVGVHGDVTPLHIAAQQGAADIVTMLVQNVRPFLIMTLPYNILHVCIFLDTYLTFTLFLNV